ncbi:hypothetical protein C8R43DRAFT_952352 [Mycena crocata]|nr:hypothetical protein C8R43DRAFT_952352 [Mycena crocata]
MFSQLRVYILVALAVLLVDQAAASPVKRTQSWVGCILSITGLSSVLIYLNLQRELGQGEARAAKRAQFCRALGDGEAILVRRAQSWVRSRIIPTLEVSVLMYWQRNLEGRKAKRAQSWVYPCVQVGRRRNQSGWTCTILVSHRQTLQQIELVPRLLKHSPGVLWEQRMPTWSDVRSLGNISDKRQIDLKLEGTINFKYLSVGVWLESCYINVVIVSKCPQYIDTVCAFEELTENLNHNARNGITQPQQLYGANSAHKDFARWHHF